jgi:hypothetical protein
VEGAELLHEEKSARDGLTDGRGLDGRHGSTDGKTAYKDIRVKSEEWARKGRAHVTIHLMTSLVTFAV